MTKRILLLILCLSSIACANQLPYLTDVNGTPKFLITAQQEKPEPPPVNPPAAMYIGIPTPFAIGDYNAIDVTYRIYDDADKRTSSGLTYYASDSGGYYTHYVDALDVNATATGIPPGYGTKAHPRTTIPAALEAGSIVEVHNSIATSGSPLAIRFGGIGTEALPIFVRGVNDPNIPYRMVIGADKRAEYMIIEDIIFKRASIYDNINASYNTTHVAVRNCTFAGAHTAGTGVVIASNYYSSMDNIVFYNNTIFNQGVDYTTDYGLDNDNGGIILNGNPANNIWLLGNTIYNCDGSGIQILPSNETSVFQYVYIADNEVYNCKQAGIALKYGQDIIISQNYCHDLVDCSWSPSKGFGMQYAPKRVWVLFNRFCDNRYGIAVMGATGGGYDGVNFIGNIIYDNFDAGIHLHNYNKVEPFYVMFNTFYHNPYGIIHGWQPFNSQINNNVFTEFQKAKAIIKTTSNDILLSDGDTVTINDRVYEIDNNGSYTGNVQVDVNGLTSLGAQMTVLRSTINNDASKTVTAHGIYGYDLTVLSDVNGIAGLSYTISESAANLTVTTFDGGIVDLLDGFGSEDDSVFDYNLLYGSDGTGNIIFNATYTNLADFITGEGQGSNCIETNPLFVNADGGNFDLTASSPFRDISEPNDVDNIINSFIELYGIDISNEIRALRITGIQQAP